jgi:CDGSH-type Zn-finger protein/uncharacterized Fe-S cluster protein YjdI
MAEKKPVDYGGQRATVSWHGRLCIHIGECGRAKGDLFVGGRQPWCQPDLSSDDEVEEIVERCPTGALSAEFSDGSHAEKPAATNTVQVAYNGPLFIRGDLEIEDAPANAPGLKYRAALCRCGQSKNKPFCDNSHEDAGFKDYGAVGETGDAAAGSGGPLKIAPARDGPLLLKGNISIISGAGRASWHGKQVALCRCGASNNKPFCDGEHKNIGFKGD